MMYQKQHGDYYVTIYNGSNKNESKKVKLFKYDSGIEYFPKPVTSIVSGAVTAVAGVASTVTIQSTGDMTQMAISIINYFVSAGLSPQAAAGLAGNSYQESGLKPTAEGQVGSKGKTLGLFQFEPGAGMAREAYLKWAGQENKYNPTKQCEYVLTMLPGCFKSYTGRTHRYPNGTVTWWPQKMTFDEFKKITDPALAAEIFCRVYERASVPRMEKRKSAALQYYQAWQNANKK